MLSCKWPNATPKKTFNLLQVFKKSFSLFTDVIDKGHPTIKYVRSVLAALKTIYFFWCLQLDRELLIVRVPFPWPFVFLYQTLWGFLSQGFFVKSFVYVIVAVKSIIVTIFVITIIVIWSYLTNYCANVWSVSIAYWLDRNDYLGCNLM